MPVLDTSRTRVYLSRRPTKRPRQGRGRAIHIREREGIVHASDPLCAGRVPRCLHGRAHVGEPCRRAQDPAAGDFEKVTLDDDTQNPMELDVAPDGRVFYIERDGRVQIWKPDTQQTVTAGRSRSRRARRTACSASQLAPDFEPATGSTSSTPRCRNLAGQQASSRFKVNGNSLDLASQQQILDVPAPDARSAATPPARCTSTPTATSTSRPATTRTRSPPTASPRSTSGPAARSGTPSARRPTRTTSTARSCGSSRWTNPTGAPGVGNTYTIPAGNLFAEPGHDEQDAARDLRDGLPQPVPVHGRPGDGLGADGRLRPGRRLDGPEPRPAGQRRVQRRSSRPATTAGPTASARTSPTTTTTSRPASPAPKFNCDAPVNNSPNNTGLTNLPPAKPATCGRATPRPTPLPAARHRRRADRRPALRLRPDTRSPTKFPEFYDGRWFIGEWNNGWIKTATLDDDNAATACRARSRPRTPGRRLHPPDGLRLRSRRLALRDRVGLGLRRQQRRLGHLPDRLHAGRPPAGRARRPRRRTTARRRSRSSSPAKARTTPRAPSSRTRGTSTTTARSTRPTRTRRTRTRRPATTAPC